ncbi:MAG: hypothetical protein M3443_14225 [Actinomycetota bacterium]|nr:hypothetical protein [Actinomycetota bacterium]
MPNLSMMLDHPAWVTAEDGRAARACRVGGSVFSIVCTPRGSGHAVETVRVAGDSTVRPVVDIVDPATVKAPGALVDPLRLDGPVGRLRNPDVWEALATSTVRQVIRAGQARKLYRGFCQAHGEQVDTVAGSVPLFPTAETVLALPDDEFARLGMKFFRGALRAGAEAYLKFGDDWAALPAGLLVVELQTVKRIGPWSAGATVADLTNDFSLYPYSDLAVRTWAARLAPSIEWAEAERDFAKQWRSLVGDGLSELTLLTLAWGARHATGVAI